jgi:hypothetical protein
MDGFHCMTARFAELGTGTTDKSASFAAIGETRRLHLRNENRFPCKCSITLLQREKPTNHFGGILRALRIAIGARRPSSR